MDTGPTTTPTRSVTTPPPADRDQDGFTADVDCDDSQADVFPGALELCDGVDNDCDEQVDGSMISWWPPLGSPRNLSGLAEAGADIDGGVVVVCPGEHDVGPGLRLSGRVELTGRDRADHGTPSATLVGRKVLSAAADADLQVTHLALRGTASSVLASKAASWVLEWVWIEDSSVASLVQVQGAGAFRCLNATIAGNVASAGLLDIQADDVEFFGTTLQANASEGPAVLVDARLTAQADGLTMVGNDGGVSIRGGELRWFGFTSEGSTGSGPALQLSDPSGGFVWDTTVLGAPGTAVDVVFSELGTTVLTFENLVALGNRRGLEVRGAAGAATVEIEGGDLSSNGAGASGPGGAVSVSGRAVAVYLSDVAMNDTDASGSAAWVRSGVLGLERGTVLRNEGGGVLVDAGAAAVYAATGFGTGPDDNVGYDVRHETHGSRGDLGAGATGTCDDDGC